ncbi:MAG: phosphoribosylglycinamide formyltransferase [Candidatus Altiarchaeales archaeon]|nr:phosphoribosylglycinamide formyltransferase [Candidatus Altiarchaeales archaeon]
MTTNIGVLASGRGSNLQAILDAVEAGEIPDAEIAVVVSDKENAFSLQRARKKKIDAVHINPVDYESRQEYDQAVVDLLKGKKVELVCMAGYMRIISPIFVKAFPNRVMNIHPALLPSFPGLNAQKQALEYAVKVTGCTVHFADEQVDHGPIIIQTAVPVLEDDDVDSLSRRILKQEHRIYPEAIKLFCEGRLEVDGRRVNVIK